MYHFRSWFWNHKSKWNWTIDAKRQIWSWKWRGWYCYWLYRCSSSIGKGNSMDKNGCYHYGFWVHELFPHSSINKRFMLDESWNKTISSNKNLLFMKSAILISTIQTLSQLSIYNSLDVLQLENLWKFVLKKYLPKN